MCIILWEMIIYESLEDLIVPAHAGLRKEWLIQQGFSTSV